MINADNEPRYDADGGLWVRPYTATNGRTHPSAALDLMSLVRSTGRSRVSPDRMGLEHAQTLQLCHSPTSVAEVAALLRQPVMVTKVLLSDLIELGAVTTKAPSAISYSNDLEVLEALVDGLRRL